MTSWNPTLRAFSFVQIHVSREDWFGDRFDEAAIAWVERYVDVREALIGGEDRGSSFVLFSRSFRFRLVGRRSTVTDSITTLQTSLLHSSSSPAPYRLHPNSPAPPPSSFSRLSLLRRRAGVRRSELAVAMTTATLPLCRFVSLARLATGGADFR